MHSAFLAMLDCTVFLTSDFPAVALVVCSEEEAAHGFYRLSDKVSGRIGGRRRILKVKGSDPRVLITVWRDRNNSFLDGVI